MARPRALRWVLLLILVGVAVILRLPDAASLRRLRRLPLSLPPSHGQGYLHSESGTTVAAHTLAPAPIAATAAQTARSSLTQELKMTETINATVEITYSRAPLAGPLCVFVPANGHDGIHRAELEAAMLHSFDNSTVLFTESRAVLDMARDAAGREGFTLALAKLDAWNAYQTGRVLDVPALRQRGRGGTAESLRGRGQLSIPLFHWISQLVKRNDSLVQNCKWFMKCDTDTYLRRRLMEDLVLRAITPEKQSVAYVGVPYLFNTRPYHATQRHVEFPYNIGGPGYTFGRRLMLRVNMQQCIAAMSDEPVLLIHDDVATGYCVHYHTPDERQPIAAPVVAHLTAAASQERLLGAIVQRYAAGTAGPSNATVTCLHCVAAWHPVTPRLMTSLAFLKLPADPVDACLGPPPLNDGRRCRLTLMRGVGALVGDRWQLDPIHRDVVEFWHVQDVKNVAAKNRQRAATALRYLDTMVESGD